MNDCQIDSKATHLFIFSAPSGTGKTSLIANLLEADDRLAVSISATTRPARPHEQNGIHYLFTSDEEFEQMVRENLFLEHATVFEFRYGTPKSNVENLLANGKDVLFDIDWQGARSIKSSFSNAHSFLIVPPSEAELRRRLVGRRQDSADVIEYRMSKVKAELAQFREFDYAIVNDEIETTGEIILDCFKSIRCNERIELPDVSNIVTSILGESP